jgi:hypothetical protein
MWMIQTVSLQTYIKMSKYTKNNSLPEVMEREGVTRVKPPDFTIYSKINCPHILDTGDCRSTKVFHVEHFCDQIHVILTFHSFSTDVNSFRCKSGYSHLQLPWSFPHSTRLPHAK